MAFIRKMKMRMSRKVLFSILAIAMIVLVGSFVLFSVNFLVTNLNTALTAGNGAVPAEKFDIKGFEALKLVKP